MPIKALNTFSRDWKIQARVSSKAEKRQTRNGGSLLKIELVDMYGTQIEGTFFNEAADQFEPKILENKVYLFSNGVVKMANKRFTSIKNDFCIVFEKNAQINEVEDDGSIAEQAFDFTNIRGIQEILQMKTLDVVGIITEISEKETV
jgi:replication factor A1